jgi:HrpA-like RNA helicase
MNQQPDDIFTHSLTYLRDNLGLDVIGELTKLVKELVVSLLDQIFPKMFIIGENSECLQEIVTIVSILC